MDEKILGRKIEELVNEIGSIPISQQKKLITLTNHSRQSNKKLKKSIANLQESLDYLRVCIKYVLFDIEATRRENKYLRRLIEDKQQ